MHSSVAYEAPTVVPGFGTCLSRPLMRDVQENKVEITKQEAQDLVECYLKVLHYRDTCSYNRYKITIVIEEDMDIIGPLSSETKWDISHIASDLK